MPGVWRDVARNKKSPEIALRAFSVTGREAGVLGGESLLRLLLHQLVDQVRRHFLVVIEDHREGAAAGGGRTQEVDVAEHLRQRHEALHEGLRTLLALVADRTATAVHVTDDVAEVI